MWKITANDDAQDEPLFTFEANQDEQTIVLPSELDVVYVFDQAGNSTMLELTQDEDEPTWEVSYENATITIDVEDLGCGIASIGETEYQEYPVPPELLEYPQTH